MNKFDDTPGTASSSFAMYPNARTLGAECSSAVKDANHSGRLISAFGEIRTYSDISAMVLQMMFVLEIVFAKAQAALMILLFVSANSNALIYASLTCLFTSRDNVPVEFVTRFLGTLISLKYGLLRTYPS